MRVEPSHAWPLRKNKLSKCAGLFDLGGWQLIPRMPRLRAGGKHRQQYFHLESKLGEPLQPGRWLALAAAVLLVTEWFLHHRRVTE
jgi:hypothetical protein